jgi:hypothetical protein
MNKSTALFRNEGSFEHFCPLRPCRLEAGAVAPVNATPFQPEMKTTTRHEGQSQFGSTL